MKAQYSLEFVISLLAVVVIVAMLIPSLRIEESRFVGAVRKGGGIALEAYCNMRFIDGNSFTAVTVFDENADINSIKCLSPLVEKTSEGFIVSGEEPWF